MGNGASSETNGSAKKQRNHSIHEFDFLMDPSLGANQPPSQSSNSGSAKQYAQAAPKDASAKINLLKKAKESGSFLSKKDILGMGAADGIKQFGNADGSVKISQPLRDIPPPKAEGDVVHPAKWLWKHPELTLCMDEHGNTYYYNYNTQESSWDPPADLSLPKAEISFQVTVPPEAVPGQAFTVEINGTPLEVMCPIDVTVGMVLELSNDTPLFAASTEDMTEGMDAVIPEGAEGEEVGEGGEGAAEPAAPAPERPTTVDDETVWKALAEVAGVEPYSVMTDAAVSRSVLTEVANGCYFPDLIYKVGWAYRFNLLKGAATACYLSGGDFLNSSLYDNCDGTPRYETSGFVEWLADLQSQRAAIDEAIKGGVLDKQSLSGDDYAMLERLSLSGDEGKLIEGIVSRKKQVDQDLDNYRSRVMAIVSVEGGPTRESLDSVFSLLKGNVQCEDEDELMDNDEMEEEVSNYLQDRHKFVVDILLTVVLLEEELETLTQRIEAFELKQAQLKAKAAEEAAGTAGEELGRGAAEVEVDEEMELLVEQHRAELQRRKAELEAKRDEQLRILHTRFDRTRSVAAWVAELLASCVQKVSGAPQPVLDKAAAELVEASIAADLAEEEGIIAVKIDGEQRHAVLVADETLAANQLVLNHERDLKKLKASLDDAQAAQRAALQERLAKKRAERVKDLMVDSPELTLEEAEAQAAAETAKEEEEGRTAIAAEAERQLKEFTDRSLAEIKQKAEAAAQRMEDDLNAHKSEQQRALMRRLERRRQDCEKQVQAQVAAVPVTPAQQEAMLAAALAKVESAAEEEAALLEAQNLAEVRAVRAQMAALVRSEHEKECERLESELQAEKDKRVKDLKGRLERKKAERAKEILASAGKEVTSAVAVALANEEVSAEEKTELAKIASETDAAMEAARKAVLENLVEVHAKESQRLEEDMKYQEKMQRTNLANRLERQRKAREKQLLAEATAPAVAGDGAGPPPPVSEQEIKKRVEAEMAAVAAQEEQALQQSLAELKSQQEKEASQLTEELTYKKTSADKRLKDRLAQRSARTAQAESLRSSRAATEKLAATDRASPVPVSNLAPIAEVPAPVVDDGSESAEVFLAALKEGQKELLARLDLFVQFEKTMVTAQKQAAVRSAPTKQKSEAAMSDLAKTSILFDHITEFLSLGFKKTLLFETKAAKDFVAKSRAEAGSPSAHRLSAAELAELRERKYNLPSKEEATAKILERFQRDIAGLLDSQALERRTSIAEMKSSGSSATQMEAAMREMGEYHCEVLLAEVEKVVITLAGVWLDQDLLKESAAGSEAGPETTVAGADSDEDEDVDTFLSTRKSGSTSTIDLHRHKQRATFGARIIQWFEDVLTMLRLYSTMPSVLSMTFDQRCADLKFLRIGGNAHLQELAGEFRSQLQKPLLATAVRAFPQHMRPGAQAVGPSQDTAVSAVRQAIQEVFRQANETRSLAAEADALFAQIKTQYYDSATGKDALCADLLATHKAAVQAFVDKPVLSASELSAAKESASKIRTPTSSKSGRISDSESRKLQLIQAVTSGTERIKAELREKYKRIGGSEEMLERELQQVARSLEEVVAMVSEDSISQMEEVNAEGLLAVVEKKAQGEDVAPDEVVEVQREVQRQKQAQKAQKDVQRVLQNATESENKLGVALKIEQAKRQQALQNRLLNKKKKAE